MIQVSVILAFYNRPDYLKLVLAGFERQTFRNFEIIVADDGSNPEVVRDVEKISKPLSFPLTHLWQEDYGFRKNKMLNRAISSANSGFLIFIDADCVPHSEFVKEHYKSRKNGICFTGRRVNLSQKFTDLLTPQKIKDGFLENSKFKLISDGFFGRSFDVEKGFYFKNRFLRDYFNTKKRGLLGCNFSINKEDILKINGFDERYEAPSVGEDSDIEYRLNLCGIKTLSLNNIAVQYHLFHKLQSRPQKNLDLFEAVKKNGTYYTQFGIRKT